MVIFKDGAARDPSVAKLLSSSHCSRVIGNTEPPAYEAGGLFVFSVVEVRVVVDGITEGRQHQ